MKDIALIFNQIKRLIKTHKVFFVLYIIAQSIAIVVLLYSSAAIQSIFAKQKEINFGSLYFEVDMLRFNDVGMGNVLVGYEEIDGVRTPIYEYVEMTEYDLSSALSLDEMKEKTNYVIRQSSLDAPSSLELKGMYNKDNFVYTNISNRAWNEKNTVRLNSQKFPDHSVGDTITLDGISYEVTDIVSPSEVFYDIYFVSGEIPQSVQWYRVRFCYDSPPTTSQAEEMNSLLASTFDFNELYIPPTVDPLTAQFNSTTILCTVLMVFAVLINICYAQVFRFRLERRSFVIYRLCGARKGGICRICLSECIFVTTIIYLICTAVFEKLLRSSVSVWYEAANSLYTTKYYMAFGMGYILFQVLLLAIPLYRLVSNDIMQEERRGTS